jgi:asparagine synthase (glutamine-hydrolysing)
MCGITGYLTLRNDFSSKKFSAANNMVRYRGPDDYGYFIIDNNFKHKKYKSEYLKDFDAKEKAVLIAFGFRRLSIIDLTENGAQPFYDKSTDSVIVFNGEVYNYKELRIDLEKLGYKFTSDTDTEVILKSYREWGIECVNKFNGMWAFCLVDIRRRRIYLSRDRLGVKPLYYYHDNNRFIFGSEVKQILPLMPIPESINDSVLLDYLIGSYGNETEETFFKNVYKIPAGYYFELFLNDQISISKTEYWNLPLVTDNPAPNVSFNKLKEELFELFEDSIKLRLRSDVPLGTCLSGGLDSSGIVCMLERLLPDKNHKVFTIQSVNSEIDETEYVKEVIKKTGFQSFYKRPDTIDLINEYPKFVWHHDEPILSASIFGGYHVYKLAKDNGVTVVLDGQGADELLGGYEIGVQYLYLQELFKKGSISDFIHQLKSNTLRYNASEYYIIYKILHGLLKEFTKRGSSRITKMQKKKNVLNELESWINKDYIHDNIDRSQYLSKTYIPEHRFNSDFKKRSYLLMKHTNLPGILRQVDRNSMAFSLEARVPFLDYRIVEHIYKIPVRYLMHDGLTKYIYREAMKNIIPENIINRVDKRGFSMPEREWLNSITEDLDELFDNYNDNTIININYLRNNYKILIQSPIHYNNILWRVINAIIWQKEFF